MSKNYDLVILGGGMGGYVSAIRARQLGLKVALVEQDKVGGTCLHKGCIPTKALLKSAEVYQTVKKSQTFGIQVEGVKLDLKTVFSRKNTVVSDLYKGLKQLMKKNKIDVFNGMGRLLGPSIFSPMAGTVAVEDTAGENEHLIGEHVILATGAKPRELPHLPFDHEYILSSDDLLNMTDLPEHLVIVGGGVIGVEWASMLIDFGVKVTLIEKEAKLLTGFDRDIQNDVLKILKKRGLEVMTNATITDCKINDNQVQLTGEYSGQAFEQTCSHVLVSVGRIANTDGIGLDNTQIEIDAQGFVKTNQHFQTHESHIYAVGDMIGGEQLAHVASHEGKCAVEHIAGKRVDHSIFKSVARCVYSKPEVGSVGLTEEQAKRQSSSVKTIKLPLSAIGKAHVEGESDGFVKLVVDSQSKDILGVHIVGHKATDLISEAGLALVMDASYEELQMTIHPHPSLSEAIEEASLGLSNESIHA